MIYVTVGSDLEAVTVILILLLNYFGDVAFLFLDLYYFVGGGCC